MAAKSQLESFISRECHRSNRRVSSIRHPWTGLEHVPDGYDLLALFALSSEWPMYSGNGSDYVLHDVIGFGASSVVHLATFQPLNKPCAVKVINCDRIPLDGIDRLRRCDWQSYSKAIAEATRK